MPGDFISIEHDTDGKFSISSRLHRGACKLSNKLGNSSVYVKCYITVGRNPCTETLNTILCLFNTVKQRVLCTQLYNTWKRLYTQHFIAWRTYTPVYTRQYSLCGLFIMYILDENVAYKIETL